MYTGEAPVFLVLWSNVKVLAADFLNLYGGTRQVRPGEGHLQ
jgi:hypothetical protein